MKTRERMFIEGDKLVLVEEISKREVALKDFVERYAALEAPPIELMLPDNCVFYRKHKNEILVLTCHAPTKRSIQRLSHKKDKYLFTNLALPWVIFSHRFHAQGDSESTYRGSKIFFANKRFSGLNDLVGIPPLHNVDNGGGICMGGGLSLPMEMSIVDKVREAETHFWAAPFNHDLGENNLSLVGGGIRSWGGMSSKNPRFIVENVDWRHRTLRDALRYDLQN